MNESALEELHPVFLALSDPTRLRLVALMANGEVPVGELVDAVGESQPKVSRHLAYLRDHGIVSTRRDGKWVYYSLETDLPESSAAVLGAVLSSITSETLSWPIQDQNVDTAPLRPEPHEELEVFLL